MNLKRVHFNGGKGELCFFLGFSVSFFLQWKGVVKVGVFNSYFFTAPFFGIFLSNFDVYQKKSTHTNIMSQ